MRVLFIWHAAVVYSYRERFRALRRVAPDLELSVIVPDGSYEGGQWITYEPHVDDNYTIVHPGSVWTNHPNGLWYRISRSVLREMKPDVVHIHEEAWSLAALQFTLAFFARAPIILESFENLIRPTKWPFGYVESWVLPRVTEFVAITPEVENVLRAKGVTAPISVIPYGSPVTTPVEQRRPKWPPIKIGYVGRFVPEKGLHTLMSAADCLKIPIEIYFVGDGPLTGSLKDYTARKPHLNVQVLAPVSAAEVGGIMRSLDVLVLPSERTEFWAEQFGRVLVEAMTVGTVPIGSTCGAIPWVIGDARLVFPEGNYEKLASIITQLYLNPGDWEQFSLSAQQRVREMFTWDVVGQRLYDVYQKLAGEQEWPFSK